MLSSAAREGRPTESIARAKARAQLRANDAGAVMFIVAMTLAVIATMGIYALNVASTEVKTAGFVREQMQTQYLSEFALLGTTEVINAQNSGQMSGLATSSPATNCMSIYGTTAGSGPLPLACRTIGSAQLGAMLSPPVTILAPWASNATETTRGSVGLPTAPDFYVEVTDPTETDVSRCATGFSNGMGLCCQEFTVTAIGVSQLTAGSFLTEGLEMSRARIIAGPTNQNCNLQGNSH
jgi:hypothetical protein